MEDERCLARASRRAKTQRIALALFTLAAFVAGCGRGGGAQSSPATTPPAGFVAVGDSISFGSGAASPCPGSDPALPAFGASANPATCSAGPGYPALVARVLRFGWFQNLGIPGARVGTAWDKELPLVDPTARAICVYLGTNDLWDASNPGVDLVAALRKFTDAYDALLQTLAKRAPGARLCVLTIPNLGRLPFFVNGGGEPGAHVAFLARLSLASAMADEVISRYASLGIAVVDLAHDPGAYDPANLSPEGLHPNDAGYQRIAAAVASAIGAP